MIRASLETGDLKFEAYGYGRNHARELMRKAWDAHRAQSPETAAFDQLENDINYGTVKAGTVIRNGQTIGAYQ